MNTNPPATGGEEEAVSIPLEKLPKLNLPPKPVLATAAPTTPLPASSTAPAAKPTSEPPPIAGTPTVSASAPVPVVTSAKKSETIETSATNKKRATLSMPLALIAFLIAMLGLIVQIFALFHLF